MIPFEYLAPRTLEEAIQCLDPEDPDIRPVGGGTAIMLMMKAGVLRPTRLVSLRRVEDKYREIRVNDAGELRIGGMASLAALEQSPLLRGGWPVLARTFRSLSNIRVRNVATIGGNLAHGDPHMDMPPVLSALGARVLATGPSGTREIAVEELCVGYYETVLNRDELISEVIVPPMGGRRAVYFKVTTRAAHDWPALGVAVSLQPDGGSVRNASLIVGAATDRPTRLHAAEALLRNATPSDEILRRAGQAAADALDIVSDQHGSAAYKKHLLSVYLGRAVRAAMDASKEGASHDSH
ncbi:MAG: FAD binding domain-containing protein [Pollutimonas bauzanensis]|uniref:Carbon-monoxide dehydrogenase medium subunit n=1 Tax=Pollutimonas bauzanensis TaxID=658167 RepID=A0A1M6A5C9_9BURK|nr:xanthine dehydrogenase family protein subunit M [Pollutimonas bauzanensis]SHI31694.1 carbon-monoxide dehydrogenase medium subunit [Pollutimonas bauzanensis]